MNFPQQSVLQQQQASVRALQPLNLGTHWLRG